MPKINTEYLFDNEFTGIQNLDQEVKDYRLLFDEFYENSPRYDEPAFESVQSSVTGSQNLLSTITESPVSEFNTIDSNEFWLQLNANTGSKLFVEKLVLDPGRDYDLNNFFGKLKL